MDIKNVIVPTDFSLPSRMALNYGVALARKFRARLTLVHVLEPLLVVEQANELYVASIAKERREAALQELWALLAPEDEDDLDVQVVLKGGNVRAEITAVAQEQHADIVVMGTHGRGPLGRLILGSTTEGVLRKLSVPVMTVCHATRPMGFKRILFATDLSESSVRGFAFALDVARTLQAEIVIVCAVDGMPLAYGEGGIELQTLDPAVDQARRRLATLITEGRHSGVDVHAVLTEGPAPDQILKAADNSSADLIFITVENKGVVERVLRGTTAEHVIREATIPVLSIPVQVAAKQEQAGQAL